MRKHINKLRRSVSLHTLRFYRKIRMKNEKPNAAPIKKCDFKFTRDPDPTKRADLNDHLYPEFIDRLAHLVASVEAPFNIGLVGEWGRGKTFVMSKIFAHPIISSHFEVATFDAWRMSPGQPILPFLIKSLGSKFGIKSGDYKLLYASAILISSSSVAAVPTAIAYKLLYYISMGCLKLASFLKKNYDSQFESVALLENQFSDFIKKLLISAHQKNSKKDKLIIFIDNLDRCLPEHALEFLEKISLFLRVDNCIFLIAYDRQVISDALKVKYGEHSHITSEAYLEKMVDLEIELPTNIPPGKIHELLVAKWTEYAGQAQADLMRQSLTYIIQNINIVKVAMAKNPRKWFKIMKKLAAFFHFNSKVSPSLLPPILTLLVIKDYSTAFFNLILTDSDVVLQVAQWSPTGGNLQIRAHNYGSRHSREHKETFAHRFGTMDYLEDANIVRLSKLMVDAYNNNNAFYNLNPEFTPAINALSQMVEDI